jgi:GNAT superfamily N-acetyltransferase
MPDQFEQYYKYLKANGADVAPDFNSFKNTLSNYDNASKYYTYLKDNKFDVPETYDSFADTFGLKKKVGGEISSLTELPSEFIEPLKKGVSPNQTKEEERAARQLGIKPYTGVTTPTNLPKQDALRYEKEVKVKDAAINTLTDVYKQKGLKFDPSRPAAQQQIQDYIDKEQSNDLGLVEGIKDKKPYLTRTTGLGETLFNTTIDSFKEPVKSFKINTISNPNELADVLDEEIKNNPNIPESVPSNVAGYFGQLAGGLPKFAAEEYLGGPALVAAEMYWNGIANERKALYQKGLDQGMDRGKAAQMAMDNATTSAIPDFVVGAILAVGVKGHTGVLKQGTAASFKDAVTNVVKSSPKMYAIGAGGSLAKSGTQAAAGYDLDRTEVLREALDRGGDLAKMDAAFKIGAMAPYVPKILYAAAKNVLAETPKPVLDALAKKYGDNNGKIVDDVNKFAQTKSEVQDLVPEAKVASVTGLTQKVKNIQQDIDDLTARKEKTTDALKPQIDAWLKEYQDEIDFYNNQIKKVVESKDPTGVTEEVDDITGQKIGTKQYVVDGKEVSQQEFEAMQGKPIGTKEIVKAEVKPKEVKRIVEPSKPISEMNSEELGDFATETKKALKKQDKDFEGKTEKEKEDGGYYDVIDEVEDLRDASERANFIENAEDVNDLANSVKSILSNIKGEEPDEYQLAILNAAKNKAIELGIDSKDLIKNIGSKIASQFKDVEDAELMVKSALEKLIPSQEFKPTEVKETEFTKKELNKDEEQLYKNISKVNINGEEYNFTEPNVTGGGRIFTIEHNGKEIGKATLSVKYPNEPIYLDNIKINEEYRRKGLASKLYDYIEKTTGEKLEPSPIKQSEAAKKLWEKRRQEKVKPIEVKENKLEPIEFSKIIEDKYGITIDLTGDTKKGDLTLSRIEVPKEQRGKEIGTKAMEDIIKYADENNKRIALTPSTDFGGTSVKRLKEFYKKFGFIENTGKNKDFTTKETMYRNPKVKPIKEKAEPKVEKQAEPKTLSVEDKEYTTKTGRQKVVLKDNDLKVIDTKTGKEASPATRKKALDEYVDRYDFSKGKTAQENAKEAPEGLGIEELNKFTIEQSENPLEIASAYIYEEPISKFAESKDALIAEFGVGKITQESFKRWKDENLITGGMALTYFNKKEGLPLDVLAKSMSDHYGREIDPQDIANFIVKYPSGSSAALREIESPTGRLAAERFKEVTGLDLYRNMAEKIVNAEFEKKKQIEKDLIKEDYETAQQLEDAYWSAYKETDGFTKESPIGEIKPTEAAEKGVEEAYKDLTINQKRQIINSKFDELLKELKIEKICPT